MFVGLITMIFPWKRDGEKPVKKTKTQKSSLKGHKLCVSSDMSISYLALGFVEIEELDSVRTRNSIRASSKKWKNEQIFVQQL